ncbi:hypothetical protein ACTFIZ_010452 [Dictyostelium cf. discoideum]
MNKITFISLLFYWSKEAFYLTSYYDPNYSYKYYSEKKAFGYFLWLISMSIILIFIYIFELILVFFKKLPKALNNSIIIHIPNYLTIIFNFIVIINAYVNKYDDYNHFTLGISNEGKFGPGTIIFIIATTLHIIFTIVSFILISSDIKNNENNSKSSTPSNYSQKV